MRRGLTALLDTGTEIGRPRYLLTLAEAYGALRQTEVGLNLISEALAVSENTGERFYEAELYRVKGNLTLQSKVEISPGSRHIKASRDKSGQVGANLESEAEVYFRKAIEIARCQQAKALELRAVISLSRLWQKQGKRKKAGQMLGEIYDWFTEGFDTADLQEAGALLVELA